MLTFTRVTSRYCNSAAPSPHGDTTTGIIFASPLYNLKAADVISHLKSEQLETGVEEVRSHTFCYPVVLWEH